MWRFYAATILVFVVIIAGGVAYFDWSQKKIGNLREEVAQKEFIIAEQNIAIENLNNRIKVIQGAHSDYNQRVNEIRSDTDRMSQEITKPSIHEGAVQNPRETENVINTFMRNLFQQFNAISRDENLNTGGSR